MIKKIIFVSFLIGFNYIVIEGIAFGLYQFKYKDYSLFDIQTSKLAAIDAVTASNVYTIGDEYDEDVVVKKIVHPYIGYTTDGKTKSEDCVSDSPEDCYSRIKVSTDKPFAKRNDDNLIVGIFGGSFAYGTVRGTGSVEFYKVLLNEIPKFKDKEVIVYTFAAGGFKQPQQIMQLNYLYSLGAEFDIVINIDGFNEMAIPYYGYKLGEVHPSFPQSWSSFMQSALSAELLDAYSEKRSRINSHANYAKFSLIEGIRYSPTLNLLWRIKNDNYLQDVEALTVQIQSSKTSNNKDFRYQEVGPDYDFTDWDSLYRYSANIWAKSSVMMKATTEINGGQYFHFLQPNQNIDGGKLLSEEELKIAYAPDAGYGGVYNASHMHLREKFDYLKSNDVSFYDLSYHFKDTSDTLYIDTCCHMNYKGYGMVVTEVVRRITPTLINN